MKRLAVALVATGFLMATGAAEPPVTVFPKAGFGHAKIVQSGEDWLVDFGDGDALRITASPHGRDYGRFLVVSNAADSLVIDAREAFRRGAERFFCSGGRIDVKPFWETEAMVRSEWRGTHGAEADVLLEGHDARNVHWWRCGKCPLGPRRRVYRQAHAVDAGADGVRWRFDIMTPGKGEIRFYGARFGSLAALDRPEPVYPKPELTFHAPFDGTADAAFAKGAGKPLVAKNLEFAPGRHGSAVRLTAARAARLAYAAKDNISPVCGTVAFWFRREWRETGRLGIRNGGVRYRDDYWRALLRLPGAGRHGGGLNFWWWADVLRLDRDDLDERYRSVDASPGPGWQHYVIVWDDFGTRLYRDGDGIPRGAKGDSYSPQREALRDRDPLAFDRDPAAFVKFWVGCAENGQVLDGLLDDLRIWSGPMDAAAARALYRAELDARLAQNVHYGLAREPRTIRVTAAARAGVSLAGNAPVLTDASGRTVATGTPFAATGGVSTVRAALPEGEYALTLAKRDGLVFEPLAYWVLGRGEPLVLPPAARPGEPAGRRLLREIRPDLATLKADAFRSVGACRMVSTNGLSYLEAGARRGDRFALRLAVPTNAPLCLVEIDWPDDRARTQDYIIQRARRAGGDYTMQVGVYGGHDLSLSGRVRTHRCLYWTRDADVAFVAMTARAGEPAAVSAVRVYALDAPVGLPETRVAAAPALPDGWRRTFASYWEDPAINYDFNADQDTERGLTAQIDRMVALMKYCGQDMLCYPGAWYHGLIAHGDYNPRRHASHFLQAWFEKFDRAGLGFMPTINQQTVPFPERGCTRAKMNDGSLHPTAISIWETGKPSWGGWHGQPPNFNILHPDVRREFLRVFDAFVADGAGHPSFRGVYLHLTSINCLWWGALANGYNDYAIDAFERDTGVKVPVDRTKPLRGRDYAAWLKAHACDKWVDWRCRVLTDFYAELAGKLRAARPDLRLHVNAMPEFSLRDADYGAPDYLLRKMREAGIDPDMLSARIPNVILGTTHMPAGWRHRGDGGRPGEVSPARVHALAEGPCLYAPFAKAAYPWMNFHDDYWESPIGATRTGRDLLTCDWLEEITWRVTCLNPGGAHAMRPYALALARQDFLGFSRGGFLIGSYGMEDAMARFAQAFRALPAVRFDTLETGDVVRRGASFGGRRWFYLLNATDAPRAYRLAAPAGTTDLSTGKPVPRGNAAGVCDLTLGPYELRSFVTPAGN